MNKNFILHGCVWAIFAAMLAGAAPVHAGPGAGNPPMGAGHAGAEQLPADLRAKAVQAPAAAGKREAPSSRPIMIMVENSPAARPQSGLTQANLLYEVLAEGGITRFLALYQNSGYQGPIGPVRSVRPYFLDIGAMYHAVPVHAGGSPDAYEKRSDEGIATIDQITNAGRYFWRTDFRKAPHNLYTNLGRLRGCMNAMKLNRDTGAAAPVWKLHEDGEGLPEKDARPGEILHVVFSSKQYQVEYRYNTVSGLYERYVNGEPHRDREDGSRMTARTVVVLGTDHKTLDSAGRLRVRTDGFGPAFILSGGKAFTAEWEHIQGDKPIRLYHGGKEYKLTRKTHLLLVPMTPAFEAHVRISSR